MFEKAINSEGSVFIVFFVISCFLEIIKIPECGNGIIYSNMHRFIEDLLEQD